MAFCEIFAKSREILLDWHICKLLDTAKNKCLYLPKAAGNCSFVYFFSQCYPNRRTLCVCSGAFLVAHILGALVNIWASRTVHERLSQNKLQRVFMIILKHVTQCSSMAHCCVFNRFWTAAEICGTEEEDLSGCETHTILVKLSNVVRTFFLWPKYI